MELFTTDVLAIMKKSTIWRLGMQRQQLGVSANPWFVKPPESPSLPSLPMDWRFYFLDLPCGKLWSNLKESQICWEQMHLEPEEGN